MSNKFKQRFLLIFITVFLLSCMETNAGICPSTIKSIVTAQKNKRIREKRAERQREKLAKDAGNTDAGVKMNSGYGNFDPDKRRTFSDTGKRLDFDPDKRRTFSDTGKRLDFDPDKRRTFSDTGKRHDFDPDERKSFFQRNRNSARNKN
ncbi:MAG: hypothetical protein J6S53_07390 [Lentisphaeria bacterium]|nr:hypothetical protein [Lentisphaeria bacterium]